MVRKEAELGMESGCSEAGHGHLTFSCKSFYEYAPIPLSLLFPNGTVIVEILSSPSLQHELNRELAGQSWDSEHSEPFCSCVELKAH